MVKLPLRLEPRERRDGLLDRHARIDARALEQVEPLRPAEDRVDRVHAAPQIRFTYGPKSAGEDVSGISSVNATLGLTMSLGGHRRPQFPPTAV